MPAYDQITGNDLPSLAQAMQQLADIAAGESATSQSLTAAMQMWPSAAEALTDTTDKFSAAATAVRQTWAGRTDAPLFDDAVVNSVKSVQRSTDRMATPAQALRTAVDQIGSTQEAVRQQQAVFNEQMQKYNQMVAQSPLAAALLMPVFVQILRPVVQQAGVALNTLGQQYQATGQVVTEAGAGHQWVGPSATDADSDQQLTPSPGQSSTDQQSAEQAVSGDDQLGVEQAGAGQAGGLQSGEDQAGGLQSGEDQAAAGADDQGGSSLAGDGTTRPATTIPPGIPIGQPPGSPVQQTTVMPLIPNKPQLAGAKPGGTLRIGSVPLTGRGLRGGAGVGRSISVSNLERQIPQAAKKAIGSLAMSAGQAPAVPNKSATAGGSVGAGTTQPPMMPVTGVGGAAGVADAGLASSAARSRRRRRADGVKPDDENKVQPVGPAPGVPAGLRGRSAKTEAPEFLAFLPVTRTQQRRPNEAADIQTLQLLDEELWAVEGTVAAKNAHPERSLAK